MIANKIPLILWDYTIMIIEKYAKTKFKYRKKGYRINNHMTLGYCNILIFVLVPFLLITFTGAVDAIQDSVKMETLKHKSDQEMIPIAASTINDDDEYLEEEEVDDYQTLITNASGKSIFYIK